MIWDVIDAIGTGTYETMLIDMTGDVTESEGMVCSSTMLVLIEGRFEWCGNFIYADNAAITKISDEVLETMLPYLQGQYGNASALYRLGYTTAALCAVPQANSEIVGHQPIELFFTSSGTESNN